MFFPARLQLDSVFQVHCGPETQFDAGLCCVRQRVNHIPVLGSRVNEAAGLAGGPLHRAYCFDQSRRTTATEVVHLPGYPVARRKQCSFHGVVDISEIPGLFAVSEDADFLTLAQCA